MNELEKGAATRKVCSLSIYQSVSFSNAKLAKLS